jgi:DNA-binding beta-propeller fold protein YncE
MDADGWDSRSSAARAVGFFNPANLAVNPADGKLYVTDRAEDDANKIAPACGASMARNSAHE